MSVNTTNAYGRITVTEEAIAQVAGSTALECYGVVDLVSKKLSDTISDLFRKQNSSRGVRVMTNGDRIFIDLYVVLKYGVSIEAVAQSLKKTVKYDVEKFTGMVVDTINVNVVGIRV
ncbi:MAG: Asp23/Gls24 family envelope stress response protein [Clostridiales bacterium]|nr:Asp23/Gls24 family envelope stress response protein [Clostridiales bacterium]